MYSNVEFIDSIQEVANLHNASHDRYCYKKNSVQYLTAAIELTQNWKLKTFDFNLLSSSKRSEAIWKIFGGEEK